MNEMCDPFVARIRTTSMNTFEITIPIRTIRMEGWKEGDEVRLIGHKVLPKKEE